MKKLVLLIVVVGGVWLGVNYLKTGQVAFFPAPLSAEQQELRDLEKELESVKAQIDQEARAAGLTGMDTTSGTSALMERKRKLEERIAEVRRKLSR